MMNKKTKGIVIIAIVFVILITLTGFFAVRYANMREELEQRESCTDHEQTITRLQGEVQALQDQIEGSQTNNQDEIKEKAMFFLNTFYGADQEQNIKPLMTDEAYKKLYSTDDYRWSQTTSTYKVTINNENIYYNKISDTQCDVLILADFDVDSSTGSSSTPFLFHIEMTYQSGSWLVSEILENTTIRYIN